MSKNTPCFSCEAKCDKQRVTLDLIRELIAGYKKLQKSDTNSLLKRHLTCNIFEQLKLKKTAFGSSLLDCIQSGLENLDSGCGIYAPDPEAYDMFKELFDPIIEDYHMGFKRTDCHPKTDWGDPKAIGNVDPDGCYVVSTRVRCARNLEGFPFQPVVAEQEYLQIENTMRKALTGLTGELKGEYYPLLGMTKTVQQKLIDDHFLFKEGDRFLQSAGATRFWPKGRGIFHNTDKTFLVWVNEEDQVRIISMQPGGYLQEIYARLVKAVAEIEKTVSFARSDRFGYLTFCPTNLGTTIRASVHIKLPKLSEDKSQFESIASQYSLQIRGTAGEHSDAKEGIYDISNKRRLGLTEFQAVKEMNDGIMKMIEAEKKLAK